MPFEAAHTHTSLVADIGGTNTRVALAHGTEVAPTSLRRFRNAEHGGIAEVIARYLDDTGTAAGDIRGVCAAAAGPVRDGVAEMTNLGWRIDRDELARALTADRVAVLNDLQAQGHAIGHLPGDGVITVIDRTAPSPHAAKLVVGIGTGFNAAPVFDTAAGRFVPPSEAGHVSLPWGGDARLAQAMEKTFGTASIEEAVSGRGIAFVDRVLHGQARETPEIMTALEAGEAQAAETVAVVVRLLGQVVGDLALTHLPFGGIYLTGGVARALQPYLDRFGFAGAMRAKGRFAGFMDQFGVAVVVDDYAALTGCAVHLARS
ncbi:MAG: glucokinase [Rhodobacteraceae bacterium]|nr:glucokinase [Paracoccaceae bacterium]